MEEGGGGGGGGKYDLGLAVSGSSSATSGVGPISSVINNESGFQLPKWAVPLLIVGSFGLAVLMLLRK